MYELTIEEDNEGEFFFLSEDELRRFLDNIMGLTQDQIGWLLRDGKLDVSRHHVYLRFTLKASG